MIRLLFYSDTNEALALAALESLGVVPLGESCGVYLLDPDTPDLGAVAGIVHDYGGALDYGPG